MADLYAGEKLRRPANVGGRTQEDEDENEESESSPFDRLVQLVHENDELLVEFQLVRAQASAAMRYLARPGSSSRIAGLWLDRLRVRRQKVLDRWDQNHRQLWALGLLDRPEG